MLFLLFVNLSELDNFLAFPPYMYSRRFVIFSCYYTSLVHRIGGLIYIRFFWNVSLFVTGEGTLKCSFKLYLSALATRTVYTLWTQLAVFPYFSLPGMAELCLKSFLIFFFYKKSRQKYLYSPVRWTYFPFFLINAIITLFRKYQMS